MARIAFRTLWTVEVRHAYWGGAVDALRFIVPTATQRQLDGARLMAREREGQLHVLAEVDDLDVPLAPLLGRTLVFGLAPRDAAFFGVTAGDALADGETRVWDNAADADLLDGPFGLRITGPTPRLQALNPARPLTMRLLNPDGALVAQTELQADDDGWTPQVTLPRGDWQVEEEALGPAVRRRFRVDPELQGAWGLLSLTVAPSHLVGGHRFMLDFDARTDTLRYYVVASRFDAAQFAQVSVVDTGAATDARPVIQFDRIDPAAFGASELSPALLDPTGSARIALFQATAAVARRHRGPRGLQLQRNGDVLVGHLPQPGAERHDAQFVVHLSQN